MKRLLHRVKGVARAGEDSVLEERRDVSVERAFVRTRAREMRQAPITIKTVSTSGNSSGSIDMPSAMPLSNASSQPPRQRPYSNTASALRLRLTAAKLRTRRRVCTRNRGGSVSMRVIARPILPISLRAPVAVTSARPWPRTTKLPE